MITRQIVLAAYPVGTPQTGDFSARSGTLPDVGDGEVAIKVSHLSIDPFYRLRMRPDSSVGPPLALGQVVESRGVGRIVQSRAPGFAVGDYVAGDVGWQSHAVLGAGGLRRLDCALGPPQRHLSLLGPSGLTAYFSMHVLGAPAPGATVVVAPAAGSVGTVAGQIARAAGARVVGVGSGAAQLARLIEIGFDAAIDHRDPAALAAACPAGVDVFLDGVGGVLHDAVTDLIRPRARIVLLGFISGYNEAGPPHYGKILPLLFKRARLEGFLLADWQARFDEGLAQLSAWEKAGIVRAIETVWPGLESAPAAFCALFGEAPAGKQIVAVDTDEGQ